MENSNFSFVDSIGIFPFAADVMVDSTLAAIIAYGYVGVASSGEKLRHCMKFRGTRRESFLVTVPARQKTWTRIFRIRVDLENSDSLCPTYIGTE